jgi:hypothetical protein
VRPIYTRNVCSWDIQMIQTWNLAQWSTVLLLILWSMCIKLTYSRVQKFGYVYFYIDILEVLFSASQYEYLLNYLCTYWALIQGDLCLWLYSKILLIWHIIWVWQVLYCEILWILGWYLYWPEFLQAIFCYCSYTWANFGSFVAFLLKGLSTLSLDAINNYNWSFCFFLS